MGWFWPTSSCPEISGQPAQKKILQPGNFRPGLPPDAPETPQEGGDRLKIEPSNRSILKQPTERNFALSQIPSVWDFRQKRTALYKRGRNRILTNPTQAVILRIERALPVDGQPLRLLQEVTADCGDRLGGYFFLPLCTCKNRPQMPTIRMPI